ncbi:hypothetical protein JDV02_003206 [Purpureocillium takamizusanense]|uniref:Helicase ATP-binding domain-containing protein n=1 Tax=Purpureocillium takamizusanense TaxID=2060973 RepID=A0A9Q8V9F4_9HYPO|nr:uncharacterized protein JDV02_003206 [Purpureocillium takamizusanense]UNI16804.1 hypothetical protein JDV02_003206 [Purpureocillium takamizusanense]
MPTISAASWKDQFKLIKKSIPEGADSRRTATQEVDLQYAVRTTFKRLIKAENGMWRHTRMRNTLYSYQITATAWMLDRERSQVAPSGGLLGDVMGLGKTVMTLTCMASNPPSKSDSKEFWRATLVVVPNQATAMQWKTEVETHMKKPGSIMVYNSKETIPNREMKKKRVIITTYNELRAQYPKAGTIKDIEKRYASNERALNRELERKKGIMFQVNWYRIVLDEAHAIKNLASRSTTVCCALKGKHRWALSGTPLSNSVEEFYPYLKFLRCHFTESLVSFKKTYMKGDGSNDNFEALVSMIMYRRTLKDTFLGHQLLDLPKSNICDIWVPLSKQEMILAREIVEYFDQKIRAIQAARRKVKRKRDLPEDREQANEEALWQYAKFTRLRQAASHAFNLDRFLREKVTLSTIQRLKQGLSTLGREVSILTQLLTTGGDTRCLSGYEKGIDLLQSLPEAVFGGIFDWHGLLDLIESEQSVKHITCSRCKLQTPPIRPVQLELVSVIAHVWRSTRKDVNMSQYAVPTLLLRRMLHCRVARKRSDQPTSGSREPGILGYFYHQPARWRNMQ